MKTAQLLTAAATIVLAGSASANVVEVVAATAHNGGNWPSTLGHISDSVNGNGSNTLGTGDHNPGMVLVDPNDPSTWTNTVNTNSWQHEWLGNGRLDASTSANNKIGYFIVDFGSVVAGLENMYLWGSRYTSPGEDMRNFNVYLADTPSVAIPAMPNSQAWVGGSQAAADYDFASGGWALLTNNTLNSPSNPYGVDLTIALGGASARYVGIEILTAENTDPNDRVGFGQVEFTAIPEPGSLALLGLGGLLVARRRRG